MTIPILMFAFLILAEISCFAIEEVSCLIYNYQLRVKSRATDKVYLTIDR